MPDIQTPEAPAAPAMPASQPKQATVQPVDNAKVAATLKSRIETAKKKRRTFHAEWKDNVERRMGKPASIFTGGRDAGLDAQAELNPDWSLTKTKVANLYSQVPTVQMTHENKQFAAAVPPFAKAFNYELGEKRTNVGVPMKEVLNDVVNAAGIGGVIIGYAARFETVEVPAVDMIQGEKGPIQVKDIPPEAMEQLIAKKMVPTTPTQRVVSYKFFVNRFSPTDGLVPAEFTGSNFDDADFQGFSGKKSWGEAKPEWNLKDEDKDKLTGGADRKTEDDLRSQTDKGGDGELRHVTYDELYYWRYRVDPEEKSFQAIWKVVYVHGLDEPVIHEPWKGQQLDPKTRKYIGNVRPPVQFCTITYITDNAIPPSDSAAGRPQVNDLRRSRSQMFQNRERSIPIRGYNTDRVDPLIGEQLMKGTWQGWIPMQGRGQDSIWEVARASYPSEDMAFDQAAKADLMETWHVGPNQMGTMMAGKKTSAEVNTTQQGFSTVNGLERNDVANFFLRICEVLAGWMVLYSDFPTLTDQERTAMQQAWDQKHILHDLVLKIRPDSQVVLDTGQRLERIFKFINMTAKSGFVNVKPLLIEAAELSGIDPSEVIVDPQPPKPEEPNFSYRFSGKDDLMNVGVMSVMAKHGALPDDKDVAAAKKFFEAVGAAASPQPATPGEAESGVAGPGASGVPPPTPDANQGHPPGADHHPEWTAANKVVKRSRDMSQ